MATTRRYCWRIGQAWEQEDDTKCEECSSLWETHRDVGEWCGCFAPLPEDPNRGTHCRLKPGHEGPHKATELGGGQDGD